MIIIKIIFLKFIILSFLGYILECIYSSFILKKINLNRGFFIGPYCPIYGVTLLFINRFSYLNSYFLLIFSMFSIFLLEYFTSYLLEKIFNRRWWDYSKRFCNLEGRVCLFNVIIFGIGGTFIVKKIIPLLERILSFDNDVVTFFSFLLFIIFIIDLFLSIRRHFISSKTV